MSNSHELLMRIYVQSQVELTGSKNSGVNQWQVWCGSMDGWLDVWWRGLT